MEFNARRAKGARLVKAYNTMTPASSPRRRIGPLRSGSQGFFAGEDEQAKEVVAGLIGDSAFERLTSEAGPWFG